jgi:tRNA pseudouridine38/39 synthase
MEEEKKSIDLSAKALTKEHLALFSKDELITLIVAYKQKLVETKPKPRDQRPFDFSKHKRVKIALKFSYLGHKYKGLVVQANTEDTVEHHIFAALKRTCLIPSDVNINKSSYARCGRTDKGVSALGNVCSLYVRECRDRNYCQMLNHCLPEDIRIIAYSEVPEHFDARFSCTYREYKYFFPQGSMDIELIKSACKKLIGLHDFRNFCKKDDSYKNEDDDPEDQQNFMRRIFNFTVQLVHQNLGNPKLSMWMCVIRGSAFLWHQVRCMMAVLFIIGRGEDDESVIDLLFDIEKLPKERPNYDIAAEANLILSECGFDDVNWTNASLQSDVETYNVFRKQYEESAIGMCLSEVMMRQYQLRTYASDSPALIPLQT